MNLFYFFEYWFFESQIGTIYNEMGIGDTDISFGYLIFEIWLTNRWFSFNFYTYYD